jgi:hypothetical protein
MEGFGGFNARATAIVTAFTSCVNRSGLAGTMLDKAGEMCYTFACQVEICV